jgi:hypothetical protein
MRTRPAADLRWSGSAASTSASRTAPHTPGRIRSTCYDPDLQDRIELPLPVAGEISESTWDQIAEGQPVVLLRNGRPATVIVDLDSWEEAELAAVQPA